VFRGSKADDKPPDKGIPTAKSPHSVQAGMKRICGWQIIEKFPLRKTGTYKNGLAGEGKR
jgi:hypothetical protein